MVRVLAFTAEPMGLGQIPGWRIEILQVALGGLNKQTWFRGGPEPHTSQPQVKSI